MEKTSRTLQNIIVCIFIILSLWINVIIWVYGTVKMLFGTILAFAASIIILLLFRRIADRFADIGKRQRRTCLAVIFAAYFGILLFSAFNLWCDVFDTWDFGFLIRTAYELTFHQDILDPVYYARYPNNTMFLQLLCGLCRVSKIFGTQDIYGFLRVTIAANCIIMTVSAVFVYLTANEIWGCRSGLTAVLMIIVSWPLTSYAAIAYTDTCALLPFSLSLYLFARLLNSRIVYRQLLLSVLSGIILNIGYRIRASLIIAAIACLIVLILCIMKGGRKSRLSWLNIPVLILVFILSSMILNRTNTAFLDRSGVTAEIREREEFPVTHWIMMSLNPEKDGGFHAPDVELSASVSGKEAKKALEIGEIKSRIAAMGIKGTLYHVFHKKVLHQWIYGSYSTSSYMGRRALNDTMLRQFVAAKGQYNRIYRMITQGFYCALMLLALAAGLANWKCGAFSLHLRLILIGVFCFYLLWEVNARYLLDFHLVFVLLACEGLLHFRRK